MNTQYGGLGYDNVYDVLKQTLNVFQKDNKFDPKSQIKTCASVQNKLNCQSGKILKYFMRAELENYKTALKKDPNADKLKYLKIVNVNGTNYEINTNYLIKLFTIIKEGLQSVETLLNGCVHMRNIDHSSLNSVLIATIQKMLKLNNEDVKNSFDRITTEHSKKTSNKSQVIGGSSIDFLINISSRLSLEKVDIIPYVFIIVISLSLWESRKLYKTEKYGETVVPKKEYIKYLHMFGINNNLEINNVNEFGELSMLNEFIGDLNKINSIDINSLCITSIEKECPIAEEKNYKARLDERLKQIDISIKEIKSGDFIDLENVQSNVASNFESNMKGGDGIFSKSPQKSQEQILNELKEKTEKKLIKSGTEGLKQIGKEAIKAAKKVDAAEQAALKAANKLKTSIEKKDKKIAQIEESEKAKGIKNLEKLKVSTEKNYAEEIKSKYKQKRQIMKSILQNMDDMFPVIYSKISELIELNPVVETVKSNVMAQQIANQGNMLGLASNA
jgi:hypothetical protein